MELKYGWMDGWADSYRHVLYVLDSLQALEFSLLSLDSGLENEIENEIEIEIHT